MVPGKKKKVTVTLSQKMTSSKFQLDKLSPKENTNKCVQI